MKQFLLIGSLCLGLFSFAQQADNNSLLWRIEGKGLNGPSYLFGTLHLPQKKFIVYSDSVYDAIQQTSVFYNEVDFLHQSLFGDTGILTFFREKLKWMDSLQKTDSWKRFIDKINRQYNVHLDYDSTDQFIQFSQQLQAPLYQKDEGVSVPDMMLAGHAASLGKRTGGLETYRLQFSMLYDVIDARLRDTALSLEEEGVLTDRLRQYYVDEKMDSINWSIQHINPTYRAIVFDNRNRTMADSIEKHAKEQSSFFAIGAGHLGGAQGVIELLKKKGFRVTPVHSNNKISLLVVQNMIRMTERARKKHEAEKNKEETTTLKIDTEGTKEEIPPPIELELGRNIPETKPAQPVKPKTKKKP
jgi:uncharacterized protein YbaP (TraB family)